MCRWCILGGQLLLVGPNNPMLVRLLLLVVVHIHGHMVTQPSKCVTSACPHNHNVPSSVFWAAKSRIFLFAVELHQ